MAHSVRGRGGVWMDSVRVEMLHRGIFGFSRALVGDGY